MLSLGQCEPLGWKFAEFRERLRQPTAGVLQGAPTQAWRSFGRVFLAVSFMAVKSGMKFVVQYRGMGKCESHSHQEP